MKIAMLLSGGVDSSVALGQLVTEGNHDITAYYLKIWLEDDLAHLGECPWEEDLEYARAVCETFDVPLKVVSLQSAYWDRVVSFTIAELKAGRTPSPDIFCNQRVKFGAFTDHIDASFDKIATGHYARIEEAQGEPYNSTTYALLKGVDPIKDQSYFLSHLSQTQLSRCLFPIGHMPKSEVRNKASQWNLPNKARRDSQGICFLGKIRYNEFVKFHLGCNPGAIVERSTMTRLGEHLGYWFHTIGQRKGLGLSGGPWYVVAKDTDKNIIFVERGDHQRDAPVQRFNVGSLSWIGTPPQVPGSYWLKVRHGPNTTSCQVDWTQPHEILSVHMNAADGGIAAGQVAVLYDNDVCLGGGIIL